MTSSKKAAPDRRPRIKTIAVPDKAFVTKKATFEQASEVVRKLREKLGETDLCQGIGVIKDESKGFVVSLRIPPEIDTEGLPNEVDGVSICIERRTLAKAFT